jgi:16S rRNA (uracil1498-N3)-methyltransferase
MPHKFLFFLADIKDAPENLTLSDEEHHHLSRVLRMGRGEVVFVTDGRGRMFECSVVQTHKERTELCVLNSQKIKTPKRKITLALGCTKKERLERAVSQCTELGMAKCIPFVSENSSVRQLSAAFLKRLRSVAVAAMKQSFQASFPAIEPAVGFDRLLEIMDSFEQVLVGSQEARPLPKSGLKRNLLVVVGPQAGFSLEEVRLLRQAGCTFASVSPNRLRSDTAAAAMLSAIGALV